MATTDEELEQKTARVQKLREQIAVEDSKRTTRESDMSNDIAGAQLDAEAARLEAQLSSAKESAKAANVRSGASAPLDFARDELARAVALQKSQEEQTALSKQMAADARTADTKEN